VKAPALCGAALCLMASNAASADVLEVGTGGAISIRASDRAVVEITPEDAPNIPAAALTTLDAPAVPVAYQASLAQAAATAGVSPSLLAALVWQESRWHPAALSAKGARGLTQLMPGTARALAVDPTDAAANLAGGARYLRSMLDMFDGNVERALAAYNAGPARVLRTGGLPAIAETRAYVASILDRLGAGGSPLEGAKP
jgi:soluble lytic murein transglycosylase-like protein